MAALFAVATPSALAREAERSTLNHRAQKAALKAFGKHTGSVVVLDVKTGAIKVMVSNVGSGKRNPTSFAALKKAFNPATQQQRPIASTFKAIVAATALDIGRLSPNTLFDGSHTTKLGCASVEHAYAEDFGRITLTTALAKSLNTVFAEVMQQVGTQTLTRYLKRFGFKAKPQVVGYPRDKLAVSGRYNLVKHGLISADCKYLDPDIRLQATPMQLALFAGVIANHGRQVRARLRESKPSLPNATGKRVLKPATARKVERMMITTVSEGTAAKVAIPGVEIAAKTGTEPLSATEMQTWLIAIVTTKQGHKLAIATSAQGDRSQSGGSLAAPITRKIVRALL
jgi:cell division protein FtsI/penicillin-binding protein 2